MAGDFSTFALCSPNHLANQRLLLKSRHESHTVDEPEESVPIAEEQRNCALMGTVPRPAIPLEMQRAIAMWARKQHDIILWRVCACTARDALRAPTFFFVDAPDVGADGTTKVGRRGKRCRTGDDAQFHSAARWTTGSRHDVRFEPDHIAAARFAQAHKLKSPSISEWNQTAVSVMSLFHTRRRSGSKARGQSLVFASLIVRSLRLLRHRHRNA